MCYCNEVDHLLLWGNNVMGARKEERNAGFLFISWGLNSPCRRTKGSAPTPAAQIGFYGSRDYWRSQASVWTVGQYNTMDSLESRCQALPCLYLPLWSPLRMSFLLKYNSCEQIIENQAPEQKTLASSWWPQFCLLHPLCEHCHREDCPHCTLRHPGEYFRSVHQNVHWLGLK